MFSDETFWRETTCCFFTTQKIMIKSFNIINTCCIQVSLALSTKLLKYGALPQEQVTEYFLGCVVALFNLLAAGFNEIEGLVHYNIMLGNVTHMCSACVIQM